MKQLLASSAAACVAWWIGKALNVPVWRNWDSGDRSDLALFAFFAVYWTISAARQSA